MIIADPTNCFLEARNFQNKLLNSFSKRKDAILQLVEALASAEKPTSVVELCQEGPFHRTFSNVHKAIDALSSSAEIVGCLLSDQPVGDNRSEVNLHNSENHTIVDPELFSAQTHQWTHMFAELLPKETHRPFRLFALDATSDPRPHAKTLEDRTFVHQASLLGAPVTIGLQASVLVAILEKVEHEAKWALPLSIERISSRETSCQTAEKQLKRLAQLPGAADALCVIGVDCGYTCLEPQSPGQVIIARSRIDRTGRQPSQAPQRRQQGRPRKYEEHIIHFADDTPMGKKGGPDEELEHEETYNGRQVVILMNRWNDIHVNGRSDLVDIVKVEIFLQDDPSQTLFEHPMLLIVSGKRRRELTSLQVYQSYLCRFDIEHFFRFQKQQLLFGGYQTPELQRQVNWWWICLMAYWLLYLVRKVTPESHRPWMPKRRANVTASPGEVKRVFGSKIFPDLGSPSRKPLSRGKSKGRAKGTHLTKRQRRKPIKKGTENLQAA